MNNVILCISLILVMVSATQAQTPASVRTIDGSSYDIATNSTLGIHNYGKASNMSYDDIDGSPYLIDEFVSGNALLANGIMDDSLLLKYDLAAKTFFAKLEDDSQIIVNTKTVSEFRLFNDEDEFLYKRVDPKYPNVFYEIIYHDENITFYKSEDVKVVAGEELGITKSNSRFFRDVRYYIKRGDEFIRVKLKKKFIWKYFSSQQQQMMNDYMKSNKIKLKIDRDYKKVLAILNI